MDPAGPFYGAQRTISDKLHHSGKFYNKLSKKSSIFTCFLIKKDAEFVDIIHTSEKFGLVEKNGHMDFYPGLFILFIKFKKNRT